MNALTKIAKQIVIQGTLSVTATAGLAVIVKASTEGVKAVKDMNIDELIK